jgi:mannose-1-phosphate guanylyltransferase
MGEARRIIPVILSGGAGSRLWPLSIPTRPKQLLALTGAESMLQQTARRVTDRTRFEAPIIVASAAHANEIETQLAAAGAALSLLILEPSARSTAPAIALAAFVAASDDILLVMPSDHVVKDEEAFRAAIEIALPLAEQGWLVTFGIAPGRPETGYGYIERGADLPGGGHEVKAFVEKPKREAAAAFLAGGRHDWNGGIFLFRAADFIAALQTHAPDIHAAVAASIAGAIRSDGRLLPDVDRFAASPSLSVDYAVMEKAGRIAVVPVDMGWSDVGSWDALHEIGAKDGRGNLIAGDVLALDTRNCLIRGEGTRIVAVGVEDLIVIAAGDSVLIVPRGQSQRVREAVEALGRRAEEGDG